MREITKVSVDKLIPAEWNYKEPATAVQLDKLIESIKQDSSFGVLPVRLIGDKYEVLDGNHRLEAIKKMGITEVNIENFGEIDLADAVIISRKRNLPWFKDNILQVSKLYVENVFKKYTDEQLTKVLPEDKEDFAIYKSLMDKRLDWEDLKSGAKKITEKMYELKVRLSNLGPISRFDAKFDEYVKSGLGNTKEEFLNHLLDYSLTGAATGLGAGEQ